MEFIKPNEEKKSCCDPGKPCSPDQSKGLQPFSIPMAQAESDEPCCGSPPGPPSSSYARSGYEICDYVRDFHESSTGPVPQVYTKLSPCDQLGSLRARFGISRDMYRVSPGLYCVGNPNEESPVLVSANYKLSFDCLRKELQSVDAWILVLDTLGVNVWCAAGKNTFSTEEVIRQVGLVGLDKVVSHRQLIVPQLGAPGVSAYKLKKGCGFEVKWGPIRAADVKRFLDTDKQVDESMRQLTFTTCERSILVPVELFLIFGPTVYILLALVILSGINSSIFDISQAWSRGLIAIATYGAGVFSGAVAVPVLLPWLPGKQFYWKGIMTGVVFCLAIALHFQNLSNMEIMALVLFGTAISSYAAMNFTGATPYTSPSGVEKEMKQGIPVQLVFVVVALISWVAAPFL